MHSSLPVPASLPPPDRRRGSRTATVFTIGKIAMRGSSRPCMVRDISEGGVRIQMTTVPPVGTRVEIEMRGLAPRAGTVRWCEGRDAGIAFDTPCSLAEVFEARLNRSGMRARQPRFDLDHGIDLLIGERRIVGRIVNISVGGARLAVREPVPIGGHGVVRLNLDLAFDRIAGAVRWSEDGVCGFNFTRPISSLALALALESWEARV